MAVKRDRSRLAVLLGPVSLFLGICFIGPLVVMIIFSFLEPGLYGGVEWNFYHWNFGRILGWADGEWEDFDWVYAEIFGRSARLAFINVLITLAICYPAALWVRGLPRRWRMFVVFLITLPFFVSLVVRPVRLGADPAPHRISQLRPGRPWRHRGTARPHLHGNSRADRHGLCPAAVHVPAGLRICGEAGSLARRGFVGPGRELVSDLLQSGRCR